MILFFGDPSSHIFAVDTHEPLNDSRRARLEWLFGDAKLIDSESIQASLIGPRANMITPWSTNAVEISQNMGISGIDRIECFYGGDKKPHFDPMLHQKYTALNQEIFTIHIEPESVQSIEDINAYNQQEGLALSSDEIEYLEDLASRLGRPLTDSEVFGFSQVNSEHCRHKIFNGTFIVDGKEKEKSLFKLIKETSAQNPNDIVSAYKDNVAFIKGPEVVQFSPKRQDIPDTYQKTSFESVLSLKAETHNFPTTVEPFNGAATGSGGEIRDRMAGGQGAIPLAGTALYMTSYPRLAGDRSWVDAIEKRNWLYQTPLDILIKASNGASDFGNKFGQPLINGSLFSFEHMENNRILGYDKVIMLAGGIGYGKRDQALKAKPNKGDRIVILGGDNYRIGMGGAAVSSADTGEYSSGIELNAVQRSNPEMQKRVSNVIRTLSEMEINPIISIHDHGAGGHLNCLSELVEEAGGIIYLDKLPLGDPTLSAREIIGNESQERMGLIIAEEHLEQLRTIAERERAPMYVVGEVTGDMHFSFVSEKTGEKPIDLQLSDMFGNSPKTIMQDNSLPVNYKNPEYKLEDLNSYLKSVLQIEAVACKDWLTNKVDRCVGGRVAMQQTSGELQLPLNNYGISALDFDGLHGIATSMGHAPLPALIDAAKGSRLALLESLCNIIWAPLENSLGSVSLSANWMWPCNNPGEDARIYKAVKALSDYAIGLGINIPTGKDSLSMKQKYPDKEVLAPGTVVISATAHCEDFTKAVTTGFKIGKGDIYYINMSKGAYKLGGSSFAQIRNTIGSDCPEAADASYIKKCFDAVQEEIKNGNINSGHDISAGGMITCLLESCFPNTKVAASVNLDVLGEDDLIKLLFAENNGLLIQSDDPSILDRLTNKEVICHHIGRISEGAELSIAHGGKTYDFDVAEMRDYWYKTSYQFDKEQTAGELAKQRFNNYKQQPLKYSFPSSFTGKLPANTDSKDKPVAAILREKGSNSERELAHAMYLAGFDVRDIHMTDLMSGRETLEDIQFLGAVGGFSNSDVLGSAKGWAGAFLYNENARKALKGFFSREDVLSIGICNGCQLFVELNLINPEHDNRSKMDFNDSHKHECSFTSVKVQESNSVMLGSLAGSSLGVWISHGEGKFVLPMKETDYNIVAKYGYEGYPANPNGSDYNTAMMCNSDGRHLVMMPHIERSIFKWNWAHYPDRKDHVSPWLEAFVNARNWCLKNNRS